MKTPLHRRSMEDRRSGLWAFSSRYLDIRSIFGENVEAASIAWIFFLKYDPFYIAEYVIWISSFLIGCIVNGVG